MEYCGSRTVSKYIRHTFAEAKDQLNSHQQKGDSEPKLDSVQARPLIKQLLLGLKAMHDIGICHRDLKVTNLLINRHKTLKIIDYGFSTYYVDTKLSDGDRIIRKRLDMFCGTPSYMAPEMIVIRINKKMESNARKGKELSSEVSSLIENFQQEFKRYKTFYHGDKVDIWAVGVVIFKILTGAYAFGGKFSKNALGLILIAEDNPLLKANILRGRVNYPKYLDNQIVHLMSQMMRLEPESRISISQV